MNSRGQTNNSVRHDGVVTRSVVSRLTIFNLLEEDSGEYRCSASTSDDISLNLNLQFQGE